MTVQLAALALTLTSAAAALAAPSAGGGVPTLHYRHRVLGNGLEVYDVRDTGSPTVAIHVWYRVGAKDDPPGRSGFAHLFEHIMFKGTRNMPDEMLDRLTEDVGGYNNAGTGDDYTAYYEVVPSNYLQTLLWAEAERLSSLQVTAAVFASERDVVKEEYRQRYEARPYGMLTYYLQQLSYRAHPYRRPGIGNLGDLQAATIEDVRQFHSTYYRPDNAVLVVVGDFVPAQLDAWVDQYFAAIPRPARPLPRVAVQEPPGGGELREVRRRPNVSLPAVAVSFLVPPAASDDTAALQVAEALLATGESSRLHRGLVYELQLASDVWIANAARQDGGTFSAMAILASGKPVEEGERALVRELERLRSEPVPAAELEKVKTQLVTQALSDRQTNDGRASALAEAVVLLGDVERVNSQIQRLQQVTASDVQRVANRWFGADNRLVLHYLPETSPSVDAAPPPPTVAADRAAAERQSPPPPGPTPVLDLPRPIDSTLANGLRVIVVERPELPLATARLLLRTGAEGDPAGLAGLADMTATLLTRGSATRSATAIADAIASLGGSLSSTAGWDGSSATVTVMPLHLPGALDLLADLVLHPAFAGEEVERLRQERLDELRVELGQPGSLARLTASRLVFGDRPYGHRVGGTTDSLARVGADHLRDFHRRHYRPDNAVLVVAGAVSAVTVGGLAERLFGGWERSAEPLPATAGAPPPPAPGGPPRVVLVDMPDAGQAAVLVATESLTRRDPEFFAGLLSNAAFGGGYSARLNQEVRVKRGLSYGAGSALEARRLGGLFSASTQTKNESAPEVAALLLGELERLVTSPPAESELLPRRAALIGNFARGLETTEGLVEALSRLALQNLPLADLDRFVASVAAVGPDDVRTWAGEHLRAQRMQLVVVGDARQFVEALRASFPQLEVIPAAELDLGAANLGGVR